MLVAGSGKITKDLVSMLTLARHYGYDVFGIPCFSKIFISDLRSIVNNVVLKNRNRNRGRATLSY